MLINEQRHKYGKVWDDDQTGGKRIISTLNPLHYESVIDSGVYDSEINFSFNRINNSQLNGWLMNNAGYHIALQGFAATGIQPPQGTLAFGGRKGQHWLGLRPDALGYLHWPSRTFTNVTGAPNFTPANLSQETRSQTLGIATINRGFQGTWSNIWTPGGGSVDWVFNASSALLKQDLIINQVARDYIASQYPGGSLTQTWFGVRYALEWRDIPRALINDVLQNINDGDFEGDFVELQDAQLRRLGIILPGAMYVRNRGGRATVRKRLYRDGASWYLYLGARVDQVNAFLPGDLVIDPPISTETVSQDSDDAYQNGSTVNISGYNSRVYMGSYGSGLYAGFRFQTIPIDPDTSITSATLTMRRENAAGTPNLTVRCQTGSAATFTTAANNISSRSTTTGTAWTSSFGTNGANVTTPDIASEVEAAITTANGWSLNSNLAVIITNNGTGYNWLAVQDYSSASANEAFFDATTAGGATEQIPPGTLRLTGVAPNTRTRVMEPIPSSTLVLSGIAPNASAISSVTEQIPPGALRLTGIAPNTKTRVLEPVPSSTLVLSGIAPNATSNVVKQIPPGTLRLTGIAPYAYEKHLIPDGFLTLTTFAPNTRTIAYNQIPSALLSLTGIAPNASATGTVNEPIPNANLILTTFAPNTQTNVNEPIPNGALNITSFAPNTITRANHPVPSSNLTLTPITPVDRVIVRESIPSATLTLVPVAPLTSQTGLVTKAVPPANLRLVSFAPTIPGAETSAERKAGGGPKGHPSKTVIIGRQKYIVHSYTELQKLLSDYLKSQQQELNEIQAKTPEKKKRIRVLKSRVSRTETRLARVHKEWIDQENEELLLLLAG